MFDQQKMAKQILEFYRTAFNNFFTAMMMFQEQMERLAKLHGALMANIPDEGKKFFAEWCQSYKKSCEDFKKVVDEGFARLEAFFPEKEN